MVLCFVIEHQHGNKSRKKLDVNVLGYFYYHEFTLLLLFSN